MAVDRFVLPIVVPAGNVGQALPGAKLFFYQNGSSTTLQDTFSDIALTVPNTNPVVADGDGRFSEIFGNATYSVKLTDAGENVIGGHWDDVTISVDGSISITDSNNTTVTDVLTLTHQTTGVAGVGIGTGLAFATETASGNVETGMSLISVSTDVDDGSEDFDLVVGLMESGALGVKSRLSSKGVLTTSGSIQLNKGENVISASELPVLSDGNYFNVTGTTAITSIASTKVGNVILLEFDDSLTLTHHATNLILPGAANIITAAGDVGEFVEYAAGDYKCTNYTRSDGSPISIILHNNLLANGHQVRFSKGADVASATALTLGTDGNYFDITGTTTIASISTLGVGTVVKLHFDGALTLTHSTDLVLPSGANITTAAGDEAEFVEYATGDWRCTNYERADGKAIVATGVALGTPVASTSGTAIDFTDAASGTKRISVNFDGVSTSGTDFILIQLGDAGGIETTGYVSVGDRGFSQTTSSTAGFVIRIGGTTNTYQGSVVFTLLDSSTNTWVGEGLLNETSLSLRTSGSKSLSAELTQIRITTTGGTNTFDAGKINITTE